MNEVPMSNDEREKQIRDEMQSCRFFNGIGGFTGEIVDGAAVWNDTKACEAGVVYRAHVGGEQCGWVCALPCHGSRFRDHGDRAIVPCALYAPPSREEAERIVDERNAHIADVVRRIEAGEDVPGVIVCGKRTEPEGKECPQSVDGKCSACGAVVESIYGLGSGYGGCGGYSICTECGTVHDFVEDEGE